MSRVGWTWGRGRGTNHLMRVNCRSTHNNAKTDWINSAHKQRHTPPPQRMAVCYRGGVCSLLAWEGSAPSPRSTQLHAGYCTPQLPISTPLVFRLHVPQMTSWHFPSKHSLSNLRTRPTTPVHCAHPSTLSITVFPW